MSSNVSHENFAIDPTRPFFLLRRKNDGGVWRCTGRVEHCRSLDEIPLREGVPAHETLDSVSIIPFAQARERGFPVHDGDEPITTLVIEASTYFEVEDVLREPSVPVEVDGLEFDTSAVQYEETIRRIVQQEIGAGKGANFVIARRCKARLGGATLQSVLSIYRSLLANEFGTYWTFLFFDGDSFLLGATPERHISARGGEVMMNPISGTFRKELGVTSAVAQQQFLYFLDDDKEVFELFMVTD